MTWTSEAVGSHVQRPRSLKRFGEQPQRAVQAACAVLNTSTALKAVHC